MKKALSISFAIILLLQSFDQLRLMLYYHLFQDHITAQYCVNLTAPQLMCAGKCYLNAQFESQNQEKQQLPLSDAQKQNSDWVAILEEKVAQLSIMEKQKPQFTNLGFLSLLAVFRLFRPPIK